MTIASLARPQPAACAEPTQMPLVARLVHKLREYVRLKKQQRINRQAFAQMMTLDDAMLNDIGVTRQDIYWANSLPLSVNAAVELKKISLRNRSRA